MAPSTPRELLDLLLEDGELTPDDLDEIIAKFPREGLLHEFKDGSVTADPKKAGGVVREYVSGFANAEGGVLIFGVAEGDPRSISPCRPIGAEPLDVWAQKKLSRMVGHFSPQPRFRVVNHPKGEVLIIAVARAPQLVPRIESGDTTFHLRFHDSTRKAPEYLITDLVLGRRKRAILEPLIEDSCFYYERQDELTFWCGALELKLVVENSSFEFADDLEVGLVGWALLTDSISPLSRHLLAHVDIEEPRQFESPDRESRRAGAWHLYHAMSKTQGRSGRQLAPFDRWPLRLAQFRLPRFQSRLLNYPKPRPMLFNGGLYLLAAGSVPVWYQVEVRIIEAEVDSRSGEMKIPKEQIALTRLVASRPTISFQEPAAD